MTRTHRISAGNYQIQSNGQTFYVQRFLSAYGDYQWMIDSDEDTSLAQTDTLAEAKRVITGLAK